MLPNLEKQTANIVVVPDLEVEEIALNISSAELSSILKDANVQAIPTAGQELQITSVRQQVVVSLAGGRIIVQDQSPEVRPKAQLAEVVDGFVTLIRGKGIQHFKSYGFNFDVNFDTSSDSPAGRTVMERYVVVNRLVEKGISHLDGAGLRLYFKEGEAKCDLRIEPLKGDIETFRYFAHINYHYGLADGEFPPVDRVRSDFPGKFTLFVELLERLLTQ